MPIVSSQGYEDMLERARAQGFAYPAVNVSSSETLVGALRGFAEANSDGIVQVSHGGARFLSGGKDMFTGARALAELAHVIAENFPTKIALHTDHCQKDKLDGFVRPLLALSAERVSHGEEPLFQSHMWDGSALPLEENLAVARDLLPRCRDAKVVLELEIGAVGGEEDGVTGAIDQRLYSTPEEALTTIDALGTGGDGGGRYMLAATFGNVHGVYQPGNVKLRPTVLRDIQAAVAKRAGRDKPLLLVFHGGSGSTKEEIREAVSYGVVKMNVDTDMQYAFTRSVASHVFTHFDGVLKVDGRVGDKKAYDPRSYLEKGEAGMAKRVVEACEELGSAGTALH
jgi:fructose-bisphosphate aldolase, class II